jgi:hypothetical protein
VYLHVGAVETVRVLRGPSRSQRRDGRWKVSGVEETETEETEMLAELLGEYGLLFLSGAAGPFFQAEAPDRAPVSVWVNCNDIFALACADAEPLPIDEIPVVHRAWKASGREGVLLWSCQRRGMRPQAPIEKLMRERGEWTDAFEALPLNGGTP